MKDTIKTIAGIITGLAGFLGLGIDAEPATKLVSLAICGVLLLVSVKLLKGTKMWNETDGRA